LPVEGPVRKLEASYTYDPINGDDGMREPILGRRRGSIPTTCFVKIHKICRRRRLRPAHHQSDDRGWRFRFTEAFAQGYRARRSYEEVIYDEDGQPS